MVLMIQGILQSGETGLASGYHGAQVIRSCGAELQSKEPYSTASKTLHMDCDPGCIAVPRREGGSEMLP